MLRQKFLLVLGLVIALILGAGVVAVLLLQSILSDLEHFSSEAFAGTSTTMRMQQQLAMLQTELGQSQADGGLINAHECVSLTSGLRADLDRIGQLQAVHESAAPHYDQLIHSIDALNEQIQQFSWPSTVRQAPRAAAFAALNQARVQLFGLQEAIQTHAQAEQQRTTSRFRWIALGLGLAFVLVINASIMLLARMTSMILRPVDQLVEASRRMAREDFDCRVELAQHDEFGELARAYNTMAAQLQANEQRKVETLHQVARMLNHELNNAIAIIQLQLDRSVRMPQSDRIQAEPLREIREALSRMTSIVSALTRVQRIVLTDYLSGLKMLDLDASVAQEPSTTAPPATVVSHASQ